MTVNRDEAGCRVVKAHEEIEYGALAGAAWAHECHIRAARDAGFDVGEGFDVAIAPVVKGEIDVGKDDLSLHRRQKPGVGPVYNGQWGFNNVLNPAPGGFRRSNGRHIFNDEQE